MRRPDPRSILVAVLALLLTLTGCGVGGDPLDDTPRGGDDAPRGGNPGGAEPGEMPSDPVRIGWVGAEQQLVAEAYAGALRHDGAQATVQQYPTRADALAAIEGGDVDVLPEYSGELLYHLDQGSPAIGVVAEEVAALTDLVGDDVRLLDPAGAGSRLVFAIPAAVTEQYDLASLPDAADYLRGKQLGGPADLAQAPYGPAGLSGLYRIEVGFVPIDDADELVGQLNSGTIGLAALRSTDPRIDLLVVLDDPQRMAPNNAILALSRADLAEGPVATTINEVQAALDEDGLLDLTVDPEVPADEAAAAWLQERGLG